MDDPVKNYWHIRLSEIKDALEANNFEVRIAEDGTDAKRIVIEEILPGTGARSISWGGSKTFVATGLYDALRTHAGLEVIDTFDTSVSREEVLERRRRSLLADLFITGTNAVTGTGKLVNLDMIGNRIGGITFGPKNVVILAGRNKVVPDIEDAMNRIRNFTAPVNAMRLDKKTPCRITSHCEDCKSPDRICNTWTVTEKSFPGGRVKIVLINEDLGI